MQQARIESLRSLFLALAFYGFFEASKHVAPLAKINPFADDPYDGIGSIAVQLALFLALISLLRAFRPLGRSTLRSPKQSQIVRGFNLVASAVLLTMLSNAVAMLRHVNMWEGKRGGMWLAAGVGGLMLWSAAECLRDWRSGAAAPWSSRTWVSGLAGVAAVLGILAVYPERLRQSLAGELFTALAGTAMLYLPLGALAYRTSNSHDDGAADVVDDVIAWCEGIKARTPSFARFYSSCDRLQRTGWALHLAAWINPRRYRWRLSLVAGAAFGLALAMAELGPHGFAHPMRALLVAAVFAGLESAAVLAGRALLADSLGLFRDDSRPEMAGN